MTFCRRALLWAIAAVLAVAAPTARAASDSAAARSALSAELPAGVTLAKANINQTAAAVKASVASHPDMATEILTAAILAKKPKAKNQHLSCEDVAKLTRAAIASKSDAASQLTETASSLDPECADTLNDLVTSNRGGVRGPDGLVATGTTDDGTFGVGFGANFPGSPGFVGSAPSGAIALPPVNNPVTSTTNG